MTILFGLEIKRVGKFNILDESQESYIAARASFGLSNELINSTPPPAPPAPGIRQ